MNAKQVADIHSNNIIVEYEKVAPYPICAPCEKGFVKATSAQYIFQTARVPDKPEMIYYNTK